jgi:hypothetical protein
MDDLLEQDQKVPVARAARGQRPNFDIDEMKVPILLNPDGFSLDARSRLAGLIDSPAQLENEFLPEHPEKLERCLSRNWPEIRTRVPAKVQDLKVAVHYQPGMPGAFPDDAVGLFSRSKPGASST